ncbi:MAG TPA: hypothetical protein ENJ42_09115 [Hellea balneolensis]|uniref:Uncharacterized protein n=1 Tax=Hellea balneolensis TaxID=287478 RepID=A0A7C5R503_9PROT|nr:hypothetical protein [Hellea balneolensis]
MSANLPAQLVSLAEIFAPERENLRTMITEQDLSTAQAVSEVRRVLDRVGERFVMNCNDPKLQKAGLWLLEIVKSGASSLDRGLEAQIVWREVPVLSKRTIAGSTLFYGVAAGFAAAGLLQGSRLTILAAGVLAALRFFDPKDWKYLLSKIPFIGRKKTLAIEGPDGRAHLADARIGVNAGEFVSSISDSLKTADYILQRLNEPQAKTSWHDDPRLLGFVQSLLEAGADGDQEFAFKLIGSELKSVLAADGIEIVEYSKKTSKYFDALPALDVDESGARQAAPALKRDGEIIKRGTVWKS